MLPLHHLTIHEPSTINHNLVARVGVALTTTSTSQRLTTPVTAGVKWSHWDSNPDFRRAKAGSCLLDDDPIWSSRDSPPDLEAAVLV